MTFQSLEYILFFPIVFIIYWTVCRKSTTLQNGLIVIASSIFYGWWHWQFLGLILLTAFSSFMGGWCIGTRQEKWIRKAIFISIILLNTAILFFFKYYNFFIQTLTDTCSLCGINLNVSSLNILLPVGISFYTFSALSYCIDVYQQKITPTKNILAYLAYLLFFPGILSGPISRGQKQLPQYFLTRSFDYQKTVNACKIILLGSIMKLCLADRLGIYVDAVYSNLSLHNGSTLLLTSVLYSIQIYADFAGYSLMAIGYGKLLGIELPVNFSRPYFAKTVTDFWHRWHISLTTWFRDYIYFPLGGNRCKKSRWMLNTMIVFLISGLWHGAAYTFIIWGALHGGCMVVERLIYGDKIKMLSKRLSIGNTFRILLTFAIINFAWIFFRAEHLDNALLIFRKIFTEPGHLFIDPDTLFYGFIFASLIFCIDFTDEFFKGKIKLINNKNVLIRWSTYVTLIVMILLFGVLDGGSFIYFQF